MYQKITMNKRKEWHLANKNKAWEYANNRCQECQKITIPPGGAIHHLKYLPNCYEKNVCVIEMMDENICKWLCHRCHREVHTAKTFKESQEAHEKTAGYCSICGKYAYGCWNRAISLGIKKCLCRDCYEDYKRSGINFENKLPIQSQIIF